VKLYCQNQDCGAELEDIATLPAIQACPRCGGSHFANVKYAERFQAFFSLERTAAACAPPLTVEFFTVKV